MPERRHPCAGSTTCLRCWQNNLIHGCPQTKKYLKKHPEVTIQEITGDCSKLQPSSKRSQGCQRRKEREQLQKNKQSLMIIAQKLMILSSITHITRGISKKIKKCLHQQKYLLRMQEEGEIVIDKSMES